MPERVALPRLPAYLEAAGLPNPGYRRIHVLAIDGRLPAQFVNGRWQFRASDLPEIVRIIGQAYPAFAAERELIAA